MRTLFTIHAGEHLVGEYIERKFKNCNVWVPSKDTGVDLLVTNKKNNKSISLQVKFSRDFLVTHLSNEFQKPLKACGWWTLNPDKLKNSPADYWVLLLIGFNHKSINHIIIKPKELYRRLTQILVNESIFQSYLWITESGLCWETRGLRKPDQLRIVNSTFKHKERNFTPFLEDWSCIEKLNR